MPSQPPSIENFRNLESLDFSNNSFNGEIPTELISLSFLAYLNLSNNHLVVEIPKGTRIQSFEADSFKGNEELCGPPLTHNCSNDRRRWRLWYSKHVDEILHRIIPQLDFAYEHHQGKKYMTRVQTEAVLLNKGLTLMVSDLVGQGGVLTDVPAVTSGFEEKARFSPSTPEAQQAKDQSGMIEISQSQEQPPKSPSPPPETLYAKPISVAAPESEVVTLAKDLHSEEAKMGMSRKGNTRIQSISKSLIVFQYAGLNHPPLVANILTLLLILMIAQQIVKSLKATKEDHKDMLMIFFFFNSRLSSISDLINSDD
ncbi:hypothetical protein JHK87_001413 [Glycine soja]|nr:hypothetical protein JHK87_001413 [Glycine soja]